MKRRADITDMPPGRVLTLLAFHAALSSGLSFAKAAKKARIAESTGKLWAERLRFQRSDLAAETPQMRIERLNGWSLALSGLGRLEEAAACEAEARRVGRMLDRLAALEADARQVDDAASRVGVFLARVGPDPWTSWETVMAYFAGLRALGAELAPDGKATWPDGMPDGVDVPDWLPEAPWSVFDEKGWEEEVGGAIRLL